MKHIIDHLSERESYLRNLQQEKEKELRHAPEGTLRVDNRKKGKVFYHRKSPEYPNGIYIRKKHRELAVELAQKDYNEKLLRIVKQELLALEKVRSFLPSDCVEEVYETLSPERQELVTPIVEPEKQWIQKWLSIPYQGKSFDDHTPELYTTKGERVRSKSEIIIADSLMRADVPYRYECPLVLKGYGKVYPDFTVLNVKLRKELYWEHLGMMDDSEYVEHALQKIATYEQNGIFPGDNLILTYETKQNPVNQKIITLMIQKYLL